MRSHSCHLGIDFCSLHLCFISVCFPLVVLTYPVHSIVTNKSLKKYFLGKKKGALFISTQTKSWIVLKRHSLLFGRVLIDYVATGDPQEILADS